MAEKLKYELGGRVYREMVKSTMAHDLWCNDQVRATGIDQMRREADEEFADYGVRVTEAVLNSGRVFDLLGGLLIFDELEDLQWTPQVARHVADMLGEISEPDDKERLHVLIGKLVASFFDAGVLSGGISRSSFARPTAPSATNGTAAT